MKRIAILGSTGSIGTQTLDVVMSEFSKFRVVALAAYQDDSLLYEQASKFGPKIVCCYNRESALRLKTKAKNATVLAGDDGLMEISSMDLDLLVVAGSSSTMIAPTLNALARGTKVAIATKEVIVCAGHLISPLQYEEQIIPIDSEPSAIFQSLLGEDKARVAKVFLTCSGGPFFSKGMTWSQVGNIRPEDALAHPRWKMGKKITIDSATLVNKGLELIEICKMFDFSPEQVEVLLHPQAEIHSGVMMVDGSAKFQVSPPDMRYPISFALNHPGRFMSEMKGLRFPANWSLTPIPEEITRTIDFARKALSKGPSALVALSAADEAAVEMFLAKTLPFNMIPEVISKCMADEAVDVSSPARIMQHYNTVKEKAFQVGRRICRPY